MVYDKAGVAPLYALVAFKQTSTVPAFLVVFASYRVERTFLLGSVILVVSVNNVFVSPVILNIIR